jgi:hypothetical protein
MNLTEAHQLIDAIPIAKIKNSDLWKYEAIVHFLKMGIAPDLQESKFLQEVYRYTQSGDREKQLFKQYQRPRSRGI